jgi:GTPase
MEPVQTAVIAGADINNPQFAYSMEELRRLAEACGVEVAGEMTQSLGRVNASHYIGTGKVQELHALVNQLGAQMVIFNDELSPSQLRNLESALQCKVVDRTILILDIFAERARTKEAHLQVDIARLQYMLPRLVGLRESLGRQRGGVGTKNRGSGETKLELDRRRIEANLAAMNRELEVLVSRRQTQRKLRKRNEMPVVCLVGYTNTGKSTLMNAMLEKYGQSRHKQVFVKDMLFATLETSVRSIEMPNRRPFLLTDTVGFVSKLPHYLVKAFRSTLEEVAEADLLIHVVDYSHPEYKEHIAVTNQTLEELGARHIPVVYAYNKSELREDIPLPHVEGSSVYLSAKQNKGIDELIQLIGSRVTHDFVACEMLIPYEEGRLLSYLNGHAQILSATHEEQGTILALECSRADYLNNQQYVIER